MASRKGSIKKESNSNIPICTPTNIQIKANLQNFTFPKNSYKEDYLSHIISKSEYDNIIQSISRIISSAWMKKRDNDKLTLPPLLTTLAVIAVLCALIYLIVIYYSIQYGTILL